MIDKFSHEGEYLSIIGSCSEYDLSVAESVLNAFCHIFSCKVIDSYLRTALHSEFFCKKFSGFFSVAVYWGICDHNAFGLNSVAWPCIIQSEIITEIFLQYRTVKGTDSLNIESRSLFQQVLNLNAVFSHNAEIVSSCFTRPVFFYVKSAEFSEAVSREEYLILAVVGYDYLRPVHHGRGDKCESMST